MEDYKLNTFRSYNCES